MLKSKFTASLIIAFLFSLGFLMAQPPDDGGGFPIDQDPIPLDGGISVLIASGLALGAGKWILQRRKK